MRKSLHVTLSGAAPLLMHNGALADPLNPVAREVSRIAARKKKTTADLERISDLEFIGGLWLEDGKPCLRGDAIEASICQSAARQRAKALYRGSVAVFGHPKLNYEGPKTIEGLREDAAFRLRTPVVIGGRRLVRTRPHFAQWSAAVRIDYLSSFVTRDDLLDVLITAGDTIGVGDFRPRFGRFSVTSHLECDDA